MTHSYCTVSTIAYRAQLAGITGTMTITRNGGEHRYAIDYSLVS